MDTIEHYHGGRRGRRWYGGGRRWYGSGWRSNPYWYPATTTTIIEKPAATPTQAPGISQTNLLLLILVISVIFALVIRKK